LPRTAAIAEPGRARFATASPAAAAQQRAAFTHATEDCITSCHIHCLVNNRYCNTINQ
jgi:hypothetical protein